MLKMMIQKKEMLYHQIIINGRFLRSYCYKLLKLSSFMKARARLEHSRMKHSWAFWFNQDSAIVGSFGKYFHSHFADDIALEAEASHNLAKKSKIPANQHYYRNDLPSSGSQYRTPEHLSTINSLPEAVVLFRERRIPVYYEIVDLTIPIGRIAAEFPALTTEAKLEYIDADAYGWDKSEELLRHNTMLNAKLYDIFPWFDKIKPVWSDNISVTP